MKSNKYALATDLELLRGQMATLQSQLKNALLDIAEVYEKTYALLKRIDMRDRRADPKPSEEPLETDAITAKIHARRNAARHLKGA